MPLKKKEKSFPRGGGKPAISKVKKGSFSLSTKRSAEQHWPKTGKSSLTLGSDETLKLLYVQHLSRETLKEDMLVLGRVCEIEEYKLTISLPGRLFGYVPITNISGAYTKALENMVQDMSVNEDDVRPLNKMFHLGQRVVTRVMANREKIMLSIMPEIVQSDWISTSLTVGTRVVASVRSHEENGYVMDTGIKNVRAFLKKSEVENYERVWNEGNSLGIGHVLECVVRKSNIDHIAATVELSTNPQKVLKPLKEGYSLDTVLPGTSFNVTVSKVLKNGIQVKYNGDFNGCIHEEHVPDFFDKQHIYSEGAVHHAVLLYILPTVKLAHLSLNRGLLAPERMNLPVTAIKIGDIMEGKVFSCSPKGAMLRLRNQFQGLVPRYHYPSSMNHSDAKENVELEENSSYKCKIINYDYMAELFICTLRKELINAEFLQPSDLKPGMKVMCKIREHKIQNGAVVALHGGLKIITGYIRQEHLGSVPVSNPEKKFPVGSMHLAKVLKVQGYSVNLTLKPQLVQDDVEVIHSYQQLEKGKECQGVVVLIKENGLLVTFFGDVKGWVHTKKKKDSFYLGQLVKCVVKAVEDERVLLHLKESTEFYKMGHAYEVIVMEILDHELAVEGDHGSGRIPVQHLTDNANLASSLLNTYSPGDVIKNAYCFRPEHPAVFTLKSSLVEHFQTAVGRHEWSRVENNQLLPCVVESVLPKRIVLQLPLEGQNKISAVNDFHNPKDTDAAEVEFVQDQSLMARVTQIGNSQKNMCVSVNPSVCWDYTAKPTVDLLISYWQDCERIANQMKEEGNPLAKLRPGYVVEGEVTAITDNGALLKLNCGAQGIVTHYSIGKNQIVETGDTVRGKVVFIDYPNNYCELVINPHLMETINTVQDGKLTNHLRVGAGVRGRVLTVQHELAVVVLEDLGRKQLAYIPIRHHLNDLVPDMKEYKPGKKCELIIERKKNEKIVCVLQKFQFELKRLRAKFTAEKLSSKEHKEINEKNLQIAAKYKHMIQKGNDDVEGIEDNNDGALTKSCRRKRSANVETIDEDSDKKGKLLQQDEARKSCSRKRSAKVETIDEGHGKKGKLLQHDEARKQKDEVQHVTNYSQQANRLSLSGGFVWDDNPSMLLEENKETDSDNSSHNEKTQDGNKKKKILTKAERRERALQEEMKIRAAEEKLMNCEEPQSVDDFDRLVLSSPNSSLCWIKYMAFHLQATEIEKARSVARRAFSTISFREEQEKLNVWCALLSLENLYGSKESLSKVLEEAVRMNDPFKTYTHMLQLYAESGKTEETMKLVTEITRKFRDNKETWVHCGEALLKVGKMEKSRFLMQKALTILEKKCHVEVISRFAHLENKFGNPERAQTLMEFILTSYPKRIDIWNSYVDMLVKNNQYEVARQVLERGTAQKLPIRKMKSLFSKFLQFEEQHGTSENVAKVRQMALDYVESSGAVVEDKS